MILFLSQKLKMFDEGLGLKSTYLVLLTRLLRFYLRYRQMEFQSNAHDRRFALAYLGFKMAHCHIL
jgi:hypothetical protein